MELRETVIFDVVRTPIGKRSGALAGWHPTDLLAHTLDALLERTGLDPERVDDVIGGNVTQVGEQGCNVTRNAWVAAGLPQSVPATSVDRQCGSSQQAVHFAAQGVMAGAYDVAIACGVESMTRAPMASNAAGGTGPFSPSFMEACDGQLMTQFEVAQILADKEGIDREDDGRLRGRVAPPRRRGTGTRATSPTRSCRCSDQGRRRCAHRRAPRPRRGHPARDDGRHAGRAAARPPSGTRRSRPDITAGNASQMSDGAAAMLIASADSRARSGCRCGPASSTSPSAATTPCSCCRRRTASPARCWTAPA